MRQSVKNNICYVVGAMSLPLSLRPCPLAGDCVIAADRGYDSLLAYGVTPDLVVGDFDSLGYAPDHPNLIRLPVEKDDTDMLFAVRQGLERGYRRFILLGGVGGRLEHTLGNLQVLNWLAAQGAEGYLAGEKTAVTALQRGSVTFPAGMTGPLSVLCSSSTAEGVTLEGLKYPLTEYTMTSSFPIGVSNQFTGQAARVTVRRGCLLLIWEDAGDFYGLLPRLVRSEEEEHG